ncbi:hypothetical protein, partial [Actinophytocola sp.]|uniref:hypothetical protein n=1 Tax=Actinophytocola sp. TaxID=1872138 RepID=UPI003899FFE4
MLERGDEHARKAIEVTIIRLIGEVGDGYCDALLKLLRLPLASTLAPEQQCSGCDSDCNREH